MKSSFQSVLGRVTRKVVPGPRERDAMTTVSNKIRGEVEGILSSENMRADVSVQGSVAKDTWLSHEADLDIFAKFPPEMERGEWTGRVLPVLRRRLARYQIIERYAEHPYLEFHVDRIRVNVVPCYAVERGTWKSATDRTPFHTEYMQSKLTPELRVQARILKKFLKGIRVYGAEIRVGGFSGMLAETLILNSGSFTKTLSAASTWKEREVVRTDDFRTESRSGRADEFDSDFIVIDPVDPHRNLAAAVRKDRLWTFVAAAREFLGNPALTFFYPPTTRPRTRPVLAKRLKFLNRDTVAIVFNHRMMVVDVLWGQLLKLERAVVSLLERYEFRVLSSRPWSDEKRTSIVLMQLEHETLPPVQLHYGPPVSREEESVTFLRKYGGSSHTIRGPWLEQDRWVVERKRRFPTVSALVRRAISDTNLGLAVPGQLEEGFRKAKVMVNDDVLSLSREKGFSESLWEFLDGRPIWLRTSHE